MKKIALISLFIVLSAALFAQNWFRDGATWTFNRPGIIAYSAHGYDKYTVEGDTIINDTTAKLINVKTVRYDGYEYASGSHIMYEFDSKVFYWDGERFKLMYDLNLNVGDTLDMYSLDCSGLCDSVSPFIVDNVYTMNINGIDLKVQEFSYTLYGYDDGAISDKNIGDEQMYGRIIERIGSEEQFVYYPSCPDYEGGYIGLRCYNDDEVSFLSYGWESLYPNVGCDGLVDMRPIFNTDWLWSIGLFSYDYGISCGSYYMKFVETNTNTKFMLLKSTDANHENWTDAGYIYSYNGKVYYSRNAGDERVLLYDFTLEEGDEFYVDALQTNLVVDSVGNMTVGGTQRKTLYLSAMGQQVVWCEGIGSLNGLLNNYGSIGLVGGSEELLCVQNNDETIYHNPRFEECYINGSRYFDPRSRWSVVQTNIFEPHYYRAYSYEVSGDTIINGVNYYKLFCDGHYYAALRESYDNKIYAYFSNDIIDGIMGEDIQDGEYLIYDFDWTPNKTLYCQSFRYDYNCSIIEQAVLGNTIDSILLLDGNYYKVVNDIVQGLGSLTGFFWYFFPILTDGSDYGVHTFYINDVLVYRNPTLDGIVEDCQNGISIYPNPTSGMFRISTDGKNGRADIYDSLGRKVTNIESLGDGAEIDLSGYGKGVYLVVFDIDGQLIEKKVMVE